MKAFLLFLSSVLTVFAVCASGNDERAPVESDNTCNTARYTFQIDKGNAAVTGILITTEDDEAIKGTMVNEFGVSALDFIYTKKNGKLKLFNVISFLNKWYIKRVLKTDLQFCLHILYETPYVKKHSYQVKRCCEETSIVNAKWHLKYTFNPLVTIQEDEIEE